MSMVPKLRLGLEKSAKRPEHLSDDVSNSDSDTDQSPLSSSSLSNSSGPQRTNIDFLLPGLSFEGKLTKSEAAEKVATATGLEKHSLSLHPLHSDGADYYVSLPSHAGVSIEAFEKCMEENKRLILQLERLELSLSHYASENEKLTQQIKAKKRRKESGTKDAGGPSTQSLKVRTARRKSGKSKSNKADKKVL